MTVLAMPVTAMPFPPNNGIPFQPYWEIADIATMDFYVSDGSALAELYYEIPSSASARLSYRIEERSENGGSWRRVNSGSATLSSSSHSYSASCSARSGYDYRIIATMTVSQSGKSETIDFNEMA
jgi:hypothetical protein